MVHVWKTVKSIGCLFEMNLLKANQLHLRDTALLWCNSDEGFGKRRVVNRQGGYVMTVARTLLKGSFANIEVNVLYFSGKVEVLCLKESVIRAITGNISEARVPNNPDETWCVKAEAVIRAQTKLKTETKSLKNVEVAHQLSIIREKLIQLQEEDLSLSKYINKKGLLVKYRKETS